MPIAAVANDEELERHLTIEEVCDVLNIGKGHGYRLARENILPVIKVGRVYRVNPTTFREWLNAGGQAYSGGWRK